MMKMGCPMASLSVRALEALMLSFNRFTAARTLVLHARGEKI